jgi:hypothetical protein
MPIRSHTIRRTDAGATTESPAELDMRDILPVGGGLAQEPFALEQSAKDSRSDALAVSIA